ncbi:MAG: type II secretion system F family protein [Rhizobiales bacterium]|nr:type II secretion system F family protein [Hyphomicrobiales bacterium]
MPIFSYRAYDADGRLVSGSVTARHEAEALQALNHRGLVPFQAKETGAAAARRATQSRRPLPAADVGFLLRDLTTLLEAALPVDQALRIAAAQAGSTKRKAVLSSLHEHVVRGNTLSDAMAAQEGVFSSSQVAVARAGEVSGSLPRSMRSLCVTLDRDRELKGRITGAFVYPGILLAMALFALGLIFGVMVPAITPLFTGQDRPMPLILVVATGVIEFLRSYGFYLAVAFAAACASLAYLLRTEEFRGRLDRAVLNLPVVGDFVRQAETARFARTFGILLGSGAPLLQAVAITAEVMGNRGFRAALLESLEALKRGARLTAALSSLDCLPEASRSLIAVGEETNRLPELLLSVADASEKDLDNRIERLMTVLTPVLTLVIGCLVGGIILAVMNAVLSTNDLAF